MKAIYTDFNLGELVFWSFRYFLGRRTIQTHVFARTLATEYHSLDERTRYLMKRELEAAFKNDDFMRANKAWDTEQYPLGSDIDRAAWDAVRQVINAS